MKKLGLVLIIILLVSVFPAQAEPNNPIGYEINGDVVTIWNPDTSYYFNKTNGAQWVENPDVYWSRNVFGFGYYDGNGDYNEVYSADDLGTFTREIESDYSTYVNATLWKDFTYNGHELRLGIRYHLKVEDTDLSVIIYVKNLGDEAIPYDLGFSWTLTDIDIPNPLGEDKVFINGTTYPLAGTYDLTFKDMKHMENGSIVYDAKYRIFDYTEFLTLEWDPSLDYQVHLECNGIQKEAVITWTMNGGRFAPGQQKQTILYWADAEGDYTGVHWNTDGQTTAPLGTTTDGTNIWVVDNVNTFVYKYTIAGVFVNSFSWGGETGAGMQGITNNGTHHFIINPNTDLVYVYTLAGVFTGFSFSVTLQEGFPRGITTDGTFIWIVGISDDVHRYHMNGTFIDQFSQTAPNSDSSGITNDGTFIWTTDDSDDEVYKYWINGTFITNWDTSGQTNDPVGITQFSPFIYIEAGVDEEVYVYLGVPVPPVNDGIVSDDPISRNVPGWVNVTVTDPEGFADLFTVDIQVNTTGDAENFTLRWTQSSNTFTEVSDILGIVNLDAVNSTRTNINATADLISFRFTMTGGTDGLCDVKVTTIDDSTLTDVTLFPDVFAFVLFGWTDVGFLINSAGEFWGIGDIMGNLQNLITGLAGDFSIGITNFLLMIRQQLRLVYQIFGWFITQFTGMVSTILSFWGFFYSMIDGTGLVVTGVGNFWDFVALGTWIDGLYLFAILYWFNSIQTRGRTQGEVAVFVADVNILINISSFFVSISLTVFELVINKVLTLFDAIMTVIPI